MLPLIRELTACDRDRIYGAHRTDFRAIESVAARYCLGVNGSQVYVDGVARHCVRSKPDKLRVVLIARGRTPKYRSSKQRLTPKGNKPLRIEVAWMN